MNYFEEMLEELESGGLEVMLSPAPDPRHYEHMVRVAVQTNPRWYKELCRRYPSSRKDNPGGKRTRVKRREILRVLRRLIDGKPTTSQYAQDLIAEADRRKHKQPF